MIDYIRINIRLKSETFTGRPVSKDLLCSITIEWVLTTILLLTSVLRISMCLLFKYIFITIA